MAVQLCLSAVLHDMQKLRSRTFPLCPFCKNPVVASRYKTAEKFHKIGKTASATLHYIKKICGAYRQGNSAKETAGNT